VDLPIEDRFDSQHPRIRNFVSRHDRWPERAKRGEGLAAAPLAAPAVPLPIASVDVVAAGVAETWAKTSSLR